MNDLLSVFGIDEKALEGLEKKPAAKKKTKKEKQKKETTKYKLPIQFCGGICAGHLQMKKRLPGAKIN